MRTEPVRGAIYVLLTLAFLAGLAGEAYGSHPGSGHEHRTHCTCVGTCHGAAASPVPAQPDPYVVAVESVERNDPKPADHRLLPRSRRYLLPLPNAPPGARSLAHA